MFQLVNLVIGGELPCNKEEAAVLAGIQLRIEESWGRPHCSVTSPLPSTPFVLDEDSTTLKPISEDKESFLLEVPMFGGGKIARPVSPLAEDAAENDEENDTPFTVATTVPTTTTETKKTACTSVSSSTKVEESTQSKHSSGSLLRKCYPSSSNQLSFLPSGGHIEDFLPPYYLGSKCMGKLIKVSRPFHVSCTV